MDDATLDTTSEDRFLFKRQVTPGLLVAWAFEESLTTDRCAIKEAVTVGRGSECDFQIRDAKVSKNHFRITRDGDNVWLEDLGSTNGTRVDGVIADEPLQLSSPSVIRAGRAVLVFHADVGPMLMPPPVNRYGITGKFHTGAILRGLREAAGSARHILLVGPSGSGKELAARALSHLMGETSSPLSFLAHNCALFSSEEEAASNLFGVAKRVFSNVDPRSGLIERADGGVLFLDEIHNLPERVQRTLLRIIEDAHFTRIGSSTTKQVDVRFVFASNAPPPSYAIAPDLLARLIVVQIPSLFDRVADIPTIFGAVFNNMLKNKGLATVDSSVVLGADHNEVLCLDGFKTENVRGLIDLADRIVVRIGLGDSTQEAVDSVFAERFSSSDAEFTGDAQRDSIQTRSPAAVASLDDAGRAPGDSHYEKNKTLIVQTYLKCEGNISATVRALENVGIKCSRRWLKIYATRWGISR